MSRFIQTFAQIVAPLRQLTKSASTLQRGPQEQDDFEVQKQFTEQTIVSYFIPEKPIRIYVDEERQTDETVASWRNVWKFSTEEVLNDHRLQTTCTSV